MRLKTYGRAMLWSYTALSVFPSPQAGAEPVLIHRDDITSSKRDKKKFNPKDLTEDELALRVEKSFAFVADFYERDPREIPLGWFPPGKSSLIGELNLGKPPKFTRPAQKIKFPVYLLNGIAYLQGDDLLTQTLNRGFGFSVSGRYGDAEAAFRSVEDQLTQVPKDALISAVGNLALGFFYLQLDSIPKETLAASREKAGIKPDGKSHLVSARNFFEKAFSGSEFFTLLKAEGSPFIQSSYTDLLKRPHYFSDKFTEIEKSDEKIWLAEKNLSPRAWLRSVTLPALFNSTVLNVTDENYAQAFSNSDRFGEALKIILPLLADSESSDLSRDVFITEAKGSAIAGKDLKIFPKNALDMHATVGIFKASALIRHGDPLEVFNELSGVSTSPASRELKALAFVLAANVYFDFNNYRLARRAYAWAEATSETFLQHSPDALLMGAESAFWEGDYTTARLGFEKFLANSGDPSLGPWARLRLAEMSHRNGDDENARVDYEKIVRLFPRHSVAQQAKVRLFCMASHELGEKSLKKSSQDLLESLRNADDDLRSQAKACLLARELATKTGENKNNDKSVLNVADEQRKAIESYETEFPTSEYHGLFQERLQKLRLAAGIDFVEKKDCQSLASFYRTNRLELKGIASSQNAVVAGLTWGNKENQQLLRCSVLLNDRTLWTELRKTPLRKENELFQTLLYDFTENQTLGNALKAYDLLEKFRFPTWDSDALQKAETSGSKFSADPSFWEGLLTLKLLQFEFTKSGQKKTVTSARLFKTVFRDPNILYENQLLCLWTAEKSADLRREQWDAIAKTRTTQTWLKEIGAPSGSCVHTLAKLLLSASKDSPSKVRDSLILKPYLEQEGVSKAGEEWLAFAQRKARENPSDPVKVKELYLKIKAEASEDLIRAAADAWLERNALLNKRPLW